MSEELNLNEEVTEQSLIDSAEEIANEEEKLAKLRSEIDFRNELKHYSSLILSGIKANNSRSNGGTKDVDQVKEAVKLSLLLINYVNSLPLNFQEKE
ncbi:MAG: hypothetical protein H7836_14150 [Magnetococcus sp. YQC-3]